MLIQKYLAITIKQIICILNSPYQTTVGHHKHYVDSWERRVRRRHDEMRRLQLLKLCLLQQLVWKIKRNPSWTIICLFWNTVHTFHISCFECFPVPDHLTSSPGTLASKVLGYLIVKYRHLLSWKKLCTDLDLHFPVVYPVSLSCVWVVFGCKCLVF